MIVVDTNVISELLRPIPHDAVLRWASAVEASSLFTTAISQAELLASAATIPEGKRRAELQKTIQTVLVRSFDDRIVPFDSTAAPHYASIMAKHKAMGRPIKDADAMIAAICLSRAATIVTRDLNGFGYLGLDVFNPWTD
jgi:predicted nucleic acid-binding protein